MPTGKQYIHLSHTIDRSSHQICRSDKRPLAVDEDQLSMKHDRITKDLDAFRVAMFQELRNGNGVGILKQIRFARQNDADMHTTFARVAELSENQRIGKICLF